MSGSRYPNDLTRPQFWLDHRFAAPRRIGDALGFTTVSDRHQSDLSGVVHAGAADQRPRAANGARRARACVLAIDSGGIRGGPRGDDAATGDTQASFAYRD